MARDISIAVSVKDNFTQAVATMRGVTQSFNKDLEGLASKLDALSSTKVTLKADTDKARSALREAEKQMRQTGNAAEEMAIKMAGQDYEQTRRGLDLVGKQARDTEKDISNLTDAVSRAENRVGGSSGGNSGSGGVLSSLADSGLSKMLGDSVTNFTTTMIKSTYGDIEGESIASVLSGALSGAAMGTTVAPGVGTAVGAVVGAVAGGIEAAGKYFEKKDDVFRDQVKTQMTAGDELIQGNLTSGIALYSQWEGNRLSFDALLGENEAESFMKELNAMDRTNPLNLEGLAAQSKMLLNSGMDADTTLQAIGGIGNAAIITGMSAQDMNAVAQTLGSLGSLDAITRQQTDIFTARGIPVVEYLAAELGESVETVYSMMARGEIAGQYAQETIIKGMESDSTFVGAGEALKNTLAGSQAALDSWNESIQRSMGDGYAEVMTEANNEALKIWEGAGDESDPGLGAAMSEAYEMAGRGQAEREALERQYKLDAANTVFNGGDVSELYSGDEDYTERLLDMQGRYQEAVDEGNNIAAENIIKEVEALSENAFQNSDAMAKFQEGQSELLNSVQEINAIHSDYIDKSIGYMSQISKGMGGFQSEYTAQKIQESEEERQAIMDAKYHEMYTSDEYLLGQPSGAANAWGLPYVPYDNYATRLHEGERVLTAEEARAYGKGAPNITVGGAYHIREEADIYKVAQELAAQLQRARQIS